MLSPIFGLCPYAVQLLPIFCSHNVDVGSSGRELLLLFLETRVGKRVNWFELSNCLWSFPFSCCATKPHLHPSLSPWILPLFQGPAIWQSLVIVPHKYGWRHWQYFNTPWLALISQPGGILWYLPLRVVNCSRSFLFCPKFMYLLRPVASNIWFIDILRECRTLYACPAYIRMYDKIIRIVMRRCAFAAHKNVI